ncbi:TatD family hydrolase [Porphyromonadaceae bacterium]
MCIIDSHAHIYVEEFDVDRDEMIIRSREAGIAKILMPNIDTDSLEAIKKVADTYPDYCYPMMGVHPTSIDADYKEVLAVIENELGKRKYCAIGEIGIDLYWDKTYLNEQIDAFMTQLKWAKELELPVAIHVRNGWHVALRCIKEFGNREISGVFHCFSGSEEIATELMVYPNIYLGIGGPLTYKNATLPQVLKNVPIERIVVETDAPYLSPVPKRGKRNEPSYLSYIIEKLSEVYGVSQKAMTEQLYNNSITLFKNTI